MTKPRVWMEAGLHPPALARLEAVAELVTSRDPADLPGSAALIVGSRRTIDGAFLDLAGPTLLAVTRPGIGVDNVNLGAATERGILVINTPDAPTESTAEHTVALLLSLAKRVVDGDRWLRGARNGAWITPGLELRDRTLGVVGLGRIGRRVAEICGQGLRMRVLAYDPYISGETARSLGAEAVRDLDELLRTADVVTLHVPVTDQTRGLIDERALRLMRPGSVLVNAGRGYLVDEAALVRVLQDGHLAGAALDVFLTEPPPPDNPLLSLPNVVVTPHIASMTDGGIRAMGEGVVEQLVGLLERGERPRFLVNPDAWPGRTDQVAPSER